MYSERLKRRNENTQDEYFLVLYVEEVTYDVCLSERVHIPNQNEDDAGIIIIKNETYDVEILKKDTKDFCKKKAKLFEKKDQYLQAKKKKMTKSIQNKERIAAARVQLVKDQRVLVIQKIL